RTIRDALVQDVRRVGDDDVALLRRDQVDLVDAYAEVGDDFQLGKRIHQLAVDLRMAEVRESANVGRRLERRRAIGGLPKLHRREFILQSFHRALVALRGDYDFVLHELPWLNFARSASALRASKPRSAPTA